MGKAQPLARNLSICKGFITGNISSFRMERRSIFSRCFRIARVFYRDENPAERLASRFGLQNKLFSTRLVIPAGQDEGSVSYLINSCKLSREAAIKASHKVKLQSLVKPDSVLALLRDYEFSDTQISTLVRRHPQILLANAQKTLQPKLEFFCNIGMSRSDLAKTLTYNSMLLSARSLENGIVPCYTFLKSIVISDVNVIRILKHKSWIFMGKISENVMPNVELVRKLGMRQSGIVYLLTMYTNIVMRKPECFRQVVNEVKKMGFDPEKTRFVEAMHVLNGKETWKRRHEAYRRWGWSEDDCLSAFRVCPLCMMISEKKIMESMDFLVNKMGWDSHEIAKYPLVLCFSLEKRVIPRFSVVRVLVLKGLIKQEKLSLGTVTKKPEEEFLDRFVNKYLSQVPQLLDVYRGKVDICTL